MKTIEIVLVDDHRIFREGVRHLLEQQEEMKVIGEAEDGRTAVNLVRQLQPRVVIMDVTMPDLNGIEATRRIRMENPGIKVIALSMHAHRRLAREMLDAGASGYLLKECAFEELVQAIRLAFEKDQIYLSPKISAVMVDDYLRVIREGEKPDSPALTSREREIVQLIAEGKTNAKIAEILDLSARTVEKHRLNIMSRLKMQNAAELIKYAIREGLTQG
ncbi:MAG: response regulator transcription factor [Nitrospirae bacterium]|nr:response regulator transcription factor [Nitrospirota bacterium]